MLGLMGESPDTVDVDAAILMIKNARALKNIALLAIKNIVFIEREHLLMYRREAMAEHPNGHEVQRF
jgi:L-serine dehydratase